MFEQELLRTLLALFAGSVGSFIVFWYWPSVRRWRIRSRISIDSAPFAGVGGIWCRVVNDSQYTIGKAVAYISLDYAVDDVVDPPHGRNAYNTRCTPTPLREALLCWATAEQKNPTRIDIYSGERQPLNICTLEAGLLEVVSESDRNPARVFLKVRIYHGELKIVCADCEARTFRFELHPEDVTRPIRFSK